MQSRRTIIVVSAVVAVVAAGIALLIAGVGSATADEVRFQAAADPGPNPFTTPADVPKGSGGETTPPSSPREVGAALKRAAKASRSQAGSTRRQDTACDREKLVSELAADPRKVKAWADTAGVEDDPQTVADFVRRLRPATLTGDTQVSNHSFVNGEAREFQAILPAGTAVLVDEEGKPATRCRAGSPLTDPLRLEQQTKCINCPADYEPPPECEGRCHRPEPEARPPKPTGTPPDTTPSEATTSSSGAGTTEPNGAGTSGPAGTPGGRDTPGGGPDGRQLDELQKAKDALVACEAANGRGKNVCSAVHEKARLLCNEDPLHSACDATVCFNAGIGGLPASTEACPSYGGGGEVLSAIKAECAKGPAERESACLLRWGVNIIACGSENPIPKRCMNLQVDLEDSWIAKCLRAPQAAHCTSLHLRCERATGGTASRCARLQAACQTESGRADCRNARLIKEACAKDPDEPQCRKLEPPKAPTLAADEKTEEKPAEEPGANNAQGIGDGDGGEDAGGGDAGGEPPAETPPEPEPEPAPEPTPEGG